MKFIDLSGKWILKDVYEGEEFILPGSHNDNKIGPLQDGVPDSITPDTLRCLKDRHFYRGHLMLTRELDIPGEDAGKLLCLYAERVNMTSRVYLDGEPTASEITSLSCPHRHYFRAKAGKHTLTLRLDNRNVINSDFMASGYSRDTQGYWCGAVGKIGIYVCGDIHLASQRIIAKENKITLYITVNTDCRRPSDSRNLTFNVKSAFGNHTFTAAAANRREVFKFEFPIKRIKPWSEFDRNLYWLETELVYEGETVNKLCDSFGFRTVKSENGRLYINGRRLMLRGTTDCALFPKTGYPSVDKADWLGKMKILKEYGLNNLRFHAWCPPKAAFEAADEMGIYLSVELPIWLNTDVCALDFGSDPKHISFMYSEGLRIIKEYGNHPSFIMLSGGNENLGDFEALYEIVSAFRAFDNRRLYTLSTNFDRTPTDADDYICAYRRCGEPIRIRRSLNKLWKSNRVNFSSAPFDEIAAFSFEVGQYCQYPDLNSIKDFDGNLFPANFKAVEADLKEKGFLSRVDEYKAASGRLAAIMYKEEIEAALRTGGMSGFQLLGLTDYTGQCLATVGVLDAFWRSKGIITPEEWRSFCSERVVLMQSDRFFGIGDEFEAELSVYDYSEKPYSAPFKLEFYVDGKCLKILETDSNTVRVKLDFIKKSSAVEVKVSSGESVNKYTVWVLENPERSRIKFTPVTKLREKIERGEDAVIDISKVPRHRKTAFYPPFWSPAFFKTKDPNGLIIDNTHEVLSGFPCSRYSDFLWYAPVNEGSALDITPLGADFKPIVECVPNFYDNTPSAMLFEVKVKNSNILFCGFDFKACHSSATLLQRSVSGYIDRGIGAKYEITEEKLNELIGGKL